MTYTIHYYSPDVQEQILTLPDGLAGRYVILTKRMEQGQFASPKQWVMACL